MEGRSVLPTLSPRNINKFAMLRLCELHPGSAADGDKVSVDANLFHPSTGATSRWAYLSSEMHQNLIGVPDSVQPVGNDQQSLALAQFW